MPKRRSRMEETGVATLWGLPTVGYDSSLECGAGLCWADTSSGYMLEKQLGTFSPSKTSGNLKQDKPVSVEETVLWVGRESFSFGLETAWMLFQQPAKHCQTSQNPGLNMGSMRTWTQKFPCFSQKLYIDKGLICLWTSLPKGALAGWRNCWC